MTYKKPKNISYTDMAIYIDENIYKDDKDYEIIYQYCYHIFYMLAKQNSLFKNNSYYDDFAIYCASKIYFRFTSDKQYDIDENGKPKLNKIKSVLNYAKKVLYPWKVQFERSEYCQNISPRQQEEYAYNFNNLLNKCVDDTYISDYKLLMGNIGKTCEKFLLTIPYKPDTVEWLNIYTSVLLTFLSYITPSVKNKDKIDNLAKHNNLNIEHIESVFKDESLKEPILYHLDNNMRDYIIVLTKQLKHIVAKDLSDILHTKVSYDSLVIEEYWSSLDDDKE